jgi:uncharacterized membrane protein
VIELNLLHKKDKDKHPVLKQKLTIGQRAADIVTLIVGSWGFIIGVLILLGIWMSLNVYMVIYRWDPYPFILLNFVLSCLAALQAPVILMSQNRQAERDRIAAKYDYQVNRKAEREISNMQKDLDKITALLKKKK